MRSDLWARIDPQEAAIVREFLAAPPVKVGALAEALGVDVIRSPLSPKVSGLVQPSATSNSGFEIRVNKFEMPERQRFTVAHELAHYLLHRSSIGTGVIDSILYRSNLTSRKETEANQLAAEIIMPADVVSHELAIRGGRRTPDVAEELAHLFRVSTPAMKVRLGIA